MEGCSVRAVRRLGLGRKPDYRLFFARARLEGEGEGVCAIAETGARRS
jgi:hypothetical protein